jgi:hypothetical protein
MKMEKHQNDFLLSLESFSIKDWGDWDPWVRNGSEGREGCLYRCGLEWIRLNDVDSKLKLLFRESQTFDVLLRTFGVLLGQQS